MPSHRLPRGNARLPDERATNPPTLDQGLHRAAADEPTASLDPQARAALVGRLGQLKQSGVAMIGVFHHVEEVRHLVDKEVVLAQDARRSRSASPRCATRRRHGTWCVK